MKLFIKALSWKEVERKENVMSNITCKHLLWISENLGNQEKVSELNWRMAVGAILGGFIYLLFSQAALF